VNREQLIAFAKQYEEKTGNFPRVDDWKINSGFPISKTEFKKVFPTYDSFKEACGKSIRIISFNWLKENTIVNDNECWEWQGHTDHSYGRISYNSQKYLVHVIMFLFKNKIEFTRENYKKQTQSKEVIRHLCNNHKCINPVHLESGSQRNNALDSRIYSKSTKLTIDDVKTIKKDMLNWDFSIKGNKLKFNNKWATIYNVSEGAITNIRLNRSWSDIIITD